MAKNCGAVMMMKSSFCLRHKRPKRLKRMRKTSSSARQWISICRMVSSGTRCERVHSWTIFSIMMIFSQTYRTMHGMLDQRHRRPPIQTMVRPYLKCPTQQLHQQLWLHDTMNKHDKRNWPKTKRNSHFSRKKSKSRKKRSKIYAKHSTKSPKSVRLRRAR